MRAERTLLAEEADAEATSKQMVNAARGKAEEILHEAKAEAGRVLESARAAGKGIVAEAEARAEELRRLAQLDRDEAEELLHDTKERPAVMADDGHARSGAEPETDYDQLAADIVSSVFDTIDARLARDKNADD